MHDQTFIPDSIEAQVVEVLKTCYDPEIPVNIFEMGLIYSIRANADNSVDLTMTLTSPACPVAGTLPPEIQEKITSIIADVAAVAAELIVSISISLPSSDLRIFLPVEVAALKNDFPKGRTLRNKFANTPPNPRPLCKGYLSTLNTPDPLCR